MAFRSVTTRLACRIGVASFIACFAMTSAVSAQPQRTLAVAPFTNISAEPNRGWIGAGIAETVGTDLRAGGDVDVLGRSEVAEAVANLSGVGSDRRTESALLDTVRELGADYLLTGAFQRLGEQLRLTARLMDVQSETAIEAFKVDGRQSELFELQDRLADAVRAAVRRLAVSTGGTRAASDHASTRTGNGNGGRRGVRNGNGNGGGRTANDAGYRGNGGIGAANTAARSGPVDAPGGMVDAPAGMHGGELLLGAAPAAAPARAPASQAAPVAGFAVGGGRSLQARRTSQPPTIDGRLDDAVWRDAVRVTDFSQTNPIEGAPPTELTEVWIAYDADQLYFAFHAHYTNPDEMRANRVDRDQIRRDDWIGVMFDTFLDQQRAYRFSVNAYGVQGDAIIRGGRSMRGPPGGGGDSSWDALFETGGAIVRDGWTAEMAIPFKSLRYPSRGDGEHRWGFQITRTMQSKDETLVWAPMTRAIAGVLTQMGTLGGLRGLSASRNLEILPTATAIQLGRLTDTGYVEDDTQPDFGFNMKYGVTSNLTADFTLNPDFSQIEADRPQIETNQRYPLFFPELRPFFLEGQEIFRTPGRTNLVHTKTIVDPQIGAKLTGKTGNTTLGVLVANDAAPGKFDDPGAHGFGETANFVIGRARYDLYSQSYIGAIMTDREFLDSYSRVGGVDGRFRLGQTHRAQFLAVTSTHRDLDGNRHSGPMFNAELRRDSRHLSYSVDFNSIDPDFRTDAGFVRRVDMQQLDADIEYEWWPESWLISWGPQFRYRRNVDHAGVLQDEDFRADLSARFARNIFFRADAQREMERFQNIDFHKTRFSVRNGINTSRRFSLFYGIDWGEQIRFVENPFLGRMFDYNFGLTLLPTSRLNSRFSLDTARFSDMHTGALVFDVKILRAFTTYQFTDRLLVRNILEHNTGNGKVGINLLFTYRVNAGTAFYIGYDDRLQEGIYLDRERFYNRDLQRQQRAFFTKLQYLFRY
jgi:TolB-like protein